MLQLMMEKGNHIKVRRQLEQVTSEHAQLSADSSQLRDTVAKLTLEAESFAGRELELKMSADRLSAELRAAEIDRDRLTRELEDRRVRDVAIQDNIEVCIITLHCFSVIHLSMDRGHRLYFLYMYLCHNTVKITSLQVKSDIYSVYCT